MKHQVYRTIKCLLEIDDFVAATHKFSKKFYKVSLFGGEDSPYRLVIDAIAISRDLIYRITWGMDAKPYDVEEDEEPDEELIYRGDAPIRGWVPKKDRELKKLYPNVGQVPDEPGEHHWITIFGCWDFTKVDNITVID